MVYGGYEHGLKQLCFLFGGDFSKEYQPYRFRKGEICSELIQTVSADTLSITGDFRNTCFPLHKIILGMDSFFDKEREIVYFVGYQYACFLESFFFCLDIAHASIEECSGMSEGRLTGEVGATCATYVYGNRFRDDPRFFTGDNFLLM